MVPLVLGNLHMETQSGTVETAYASKKGGYMGFAVMCGRVIVCSANCSRKAGKGLAMRCSICARALLTSGKVRH